MNFTRAITPKITIADQPDETDLKGLKDQGFTGVVNLRNDGEPEQPIGTGAEAEMARGLGLDYVHYGVGGAPLAEEGVGEVCRFLDGQEKVLVHCRKGGRAAALVLIHQAKAQGWSAGEAAARGKAIGLDVEGGLKTMVETYLANHQPPDKTA